MHERAEKTPWAARACYALGGLATGLFLGVRLAAFLVQARGIPLPLGAALALGPLLALLGGLCAPLVNGHLARYAFGGQRAGWILYPLCVVFALRFRGLVLDRAVEGGGIALSRGMNLLVLAGGGILLALFLLHLLFALRECLGGAGTWLRGLSRRDVCAILVLWGLVNLLVYAYARGSATIYSWDSAIYWRSTYSLAETFRDQGVAAALSRVYESIFTTDYNDTIGLLCVPFALLFGPSRLVYLIWGYARSLRPRGYWLPAAGMLALPSLFYTSVTGYVDIAGTAVALGALLLHLKEPGKGRFSRYLLIGLLAAGAVVLRRWYAFYALAFLLVLCVEALAFRRSPAPVLGYLCGFGFPLLYFLQTFVSGRLLADYAQMYAAYDLGLGVDVRILQRYYGLFLLLAAVALGLWLCRGKATRRQALFLLLEPAVCAFLFVHVQSHGQQHLLLYAPALACLLVLGFHYLAGRGKLGVILTAAIVLPTALSPALPRVSDVDRDEYLVNLAAVDQRDGFWDSIYTCDILAVADPIQLHLGEENQQVVWAPAHCLLEGEAIAGAYRKLDETFVLESDGITVYFFEKLREPTPEEKQELADLIHQVHPEMEIHTGA